MSTYAILTQGFGVFGNVNLVPTLGFGSSSTPPAPVVSQDTHDGAAYKRYRKRLERAAQAAEQYNQTKYIKEAINVAAVVEDISVPSPVISAIAHNISQQVAIQNLDFSAIQSEINKAIAYLDHLIDMREQEYEDEAIILMLM